MHTDSTFLNVDLKYTEQQSIHQWQLTFIYPCALLKKIPEDFNIFRLIQEMRTQRHSAVQTKVCCYSFVITQRARILSYKPI